jgi:hypothetical protein
MAATVRELNELHAISEFDRIELIHAELSEKTGPLLRCVTSRFVNVIRPIAPRDENFASRQSWNRQD